MITEIIEREKDDQLLICKFDEVAELPWKVTFRDIHLMPAVCEEVAVVISEKYLYLMKTSRDEVGL